MKILRMRYLKIVLIMAVLVFGADNIFSQNYHFKEFHKQESLSNIQVSNFFQDSFGFLWIATSDGLNRYDGSSVKIYKNKQGDPNSLPDNDVNRIIEDKDRNLWVSCFNSIGKLDRNTDKFIKYSLDHFGFKRPPQVYNALLDSDGHVWFTLSELGLIRYDKETNQFVNIKLSDENESTYWGEVHSVIQLRNGVILAADVTSGIKKYNPTIDMFEPFLLKPNYSTEGITEMLEGRSGDIWLLGGGLYIKYSPSQYIVKEFDLLKNSIIKNIFDYPNGIVEDDEGNLWIAIHTKGLFKFDNQIEKIKQYIHDPSDLHSILDNKISMLYKDKYGIIWMSYVDGGVTLLDPISNPFEFTPINLQSDNQNNQIIVRQIESSLIDKNELIIGTNNEGILIYNKESKKTKKLILHDGIINSDTTLNVTSLTTDHEGNIWYSVNNSSLKKYDKKSGIIFSFNSPHDGKTAQPRIISDIKISANNHIWISSTYGVDQFDSRKNVFTPIPRIMNKPIPNDLQESIISIKKNKQPISSLLKVGEGENLESDFILDTQSKVLVMSMGEGRAIGGMFDSGTLLGKNGKTIWSLSDIYKTFYAGGAFKNRFGLDALNLEKGDYKLSFSSDIGHSYGNWNALPPTDSTSWGIQIFNLSDNEYSEFKTMITEAMQNNEYLPFEMGRIVYFSKKYSNNIWIGTNTNSFFRYDLLSGEYKQFNFDEANLTNASHFINTFYEDLDGTIWVGTYASLIRVDSNTDELSVFSTEEGLPGGIIFSIVEDNLGALWIYSSGGLSKLNKNAPIKEYAFVNYDSRDGIEGLTSTRAVWKDESGEIYFGGRGGLISFMPGSINEKKPDIVVYNFKIDDVSIFDDSLDYSLQYGIYNTNSIELSYDQNDIAFEFSAIHFSRPEKNNLMYQLEGFNNKWYVSDRNYASFTNLDPGKYVFRVKGSNGDGIWNEKGRTISILINPPWWQTTLAYIGYGLSLILLIFSVDRFQRRRLLNKAKERMKIQEAEHRAEAAELQSRAIQAESERKTKELEEARELQLSMLPKQLPQLPNLDIAVYMKTATEVGGDYYDFNLGIDGTLTVVLGDATGHGMKAGTMVTTTKSLFNVLAPNPNIIDTFHEMTRCLKLMQLEKLSMCMTMLKIQENKIQMSSAGMPPILFYRKESQSVEEYVLKGMPLGTFQDFPYTLKSSKLSMGDTILLMSDGYPELMNEEKEMYGYKRAKNLFEESVNRTPEEIIETLTKAGSDWVNDQDPDDDVTFVVIKVK